MKRRVLFVGKDEILNFFNTNDRQDIKVVAPEILSEEMFKRLQSKGRQVKREKILAGEKWLHTKNEEENYICESTDFIDEKILNFSHGPFAISFANEKAAQNEHFHKRHWEIYFSEHSIKSKYKFTEKDEIKSIELANGGAILFGPEVIHKMTLGGITIIIEVGSVPGDKTDIQ
jgi:hypothetical protein